MAKTQTRGVRNFNPGNIDRNSTKWQGMATDQSGDPRFVVFTSAQFGIRALAKTLMTYQTTHKCDTVRKIIMRWAPEIENNTTAYIRAVANDVGVLPDDVIDIDQMEVMAPMVRAIIAHENAGYKYPESVLMEGLRLAGISDARPKALAKQLPFVAQAATGASVCGAAVAQFSAPIKSAADQLAPFASAPIIQNAVTVLITLAGVCAGVGILASWLKHRQS